MWLGHAAHQDPDADGTTTVAGVPADAVAGQLVAAEVVDTEGVDLVARALVPAAGSGRAVTAMTDVAPDPAATPPQSAKLVNLPNALTVLRLAVVPVFAVLLLQDGGPDDAGRYWATLVFALAIITDRYDGMIARRTGQVTEFGKLADPIADKALTGTALIGLSVLGLLPWWVTVVILVREVGVTVLRFWVIRHGVIAGQPRRQGQDRRPGAGDRALHPAADRCAGQRPLVGDGGRRRAHRASPGSTTSTGR